MGFLLRLELQVVKVIHIRCPFYESGGTVDFWLPHKTLTKMQTEWKCFRWHRGTEKLWLFCKFIATPGWRAMDFRPNQWGVTNKHKLCKFLTLIIRAARTAPCSCSIIWVVIN